LAFGSQTHFDLGLLSLGLIPTNFIGLVSLNLTSSTYTGFVSLDLLWTQTYFDLGLLSLGLVYIYIYIREKREW